MKNIRSLILTVAASLLLFLPMKAQAQQPRQIKVSEFSVSNIPTIEERVFMVHAILEKGYICYKNNYLSNTIDVYIQDNASEELSDFDFFYDHVLYDQLNEFSYLDKEQRGELFVEWRQGIDDEVFRTLYEDFTRGVRTDNATCETAAPFCTDIGLYDFPAGVNSGSPCGSTYNASCSAPYRCSGTPGQSSNCLVTAPNPAFYYLLIDEPGNLNIYMHSTPQVDIDFDCWGPFNDINTACDLLSCSNIVDCSYSTSATEYCRINNAQTGQFYILLITNYSNDPCNISFENIGSGTTDCSILPPLVNGGGPYCVGETIQLTAQNQAGASFRWTGPNNFISNEQNPTIPNCTMAMAGVYVCTITIGDESSSAETEYVDVVAMPTANFSFVTACEGEAVQFTSTSTTNPSGQEITSFEWDFGDGQSASGQNVNHVFAQYGDYEVTLHVGTGSGTCSDEKTQTVTVYAVPVVNTSANPSSVMYGSTSTLTATVEPSGNYSYHWEPANMVTNPNSQTTQTIAIEDTQVFTVTVTNLDGGCTSSAQVTVVMAGSNMSATVSADHTTLCEGESTALHALPVAGTGVYTYNWTPANTLSNAHIQSPVATPPVGTTTYNCTINDGLTTVEVNISITVNPILTGDDYKAVCSNDLPYTWQGETFNNAGTRTITIPSTVTGCDSIVQLHLSVNQVTTGPDDQNRCDAYTWIDGNTYYANNNTATYTLTNAAGCDSIVTLNLQMDYTPNPIEITPADPNNEAPHWVVTATEFQINSYEFYVRERSHPTCSWPYPVEWRFVKKLGNNDWVEDPDMQWILEPDSTTNPIGKKVKMFVLNYVEDTVWLEATVKNECAPQGSKRHYWFVCSFYGVEENGPSTGSGTFDFDVVPNPNNGQMTFNFAHLTGKIDIKVYDMRGVLIDNIQTFNTIDTYSMPYDMNTRAEGLYLFVATGKEGTVVKKVVIQQ